ncbi:hypothetical protein HDU97_003235 [Phlyctochytrium planicorne]|nr:hypothetical protein HDU97_003235 [Phlyctochytrium planicorne]
MAPFEVSAEHNKQRTFFITLLALHFAFGGALAGIHGSDGGYIGAGANGGLMLIAIVLGVLVIQLKQQVLIYIYAATTFLWFAFDLFYILNLLRIVVLSFMENDMRKLFFGNKLAEYVGSVADGTGLSQPIFYPIILGLTGVSMLVAATGCVSSLFMKYLTFDLEESVSLERSIVLVEGPKNTNYPGMQPIQGSTLPHTMNGNNIYNNYNNNPNNNTMGSSSTWKRHQENQYYSENTRGFGPRPSEDINNPTLSKWNTTQPTPSEPRDTYNFSEIANQYTAAAAAAAAPSAAGTTGWGQDRDRGWGTMRSEESSGQQDYGYGSAGRPEAINTAARRQAPPRNDALRSNLSPATSTPTPSNITPIPPATKKPKEPKVRCRSCGEKMTLSASASHVCPASASPSDVAPIAASAPRNQPISQGTPQPGARMKVVKRYKAMLEDEVSLEIDDVVEVEDTFEDGWGSGTNVSTGEFGAFPLSCLGSGRSNAKRVQSIYGSVRQSQRY